MSELLRRHGVRIAALAVLALCYGFARLPSASAPERARLAARFAFTRFALPEPATGRRRGVRAVHPSLAGISAWISSVGASVALADLDGDGLANDVCYVDNATDSIVVTPVPGSGDRYPTFVLAPAPVAYDPATMAPMGCLPGDLNEDGATDLLAYYWGRTPIAFLRRGGGGPLAPGAYVPRELVPGEERWYTNAATRADVDGDGHPDLVIGNYFADGARILDAAAPGRESMQHSMSRAANAGHNRLLLWQGGTGGGQPTVAYREVDGVLPDRAEVGWTLAVGAADLDGDLLPELYFANDFGPDRLLSNRSRPGAPRLVAVFGHRGIATPRSKVVGEDSFKGMGVDFADLNGDGIPDLFVSNIAHQYALEESHFLWLSTGDREALRRGEAPYFDASEPLGLSRSGWGWETRLDDFDDDGTDEAIQATGFVRGRTNRWPELHEVAMGNDMLLEHPGVWPRVEPGDDLSGDDPNPFYVRAADGRFYDVAAELGLAQPMVTRGIATADTDGDGDLDFALGNQWETSLYYRNDAAGGRSLVLQLLLPPLGAAGAAAGGCTATEAAARGGGWEGGRFVAGVFAVGAEAEVTLPDGRRLVAQVDGGNGHSGARSPEVHFGLGGVDPAVPLPVAIAWRARGGAVCRRTVALVPGRHALLLGWPRGERGEEG
jgi:enediyne biosynthesis protein E4